MFASTNVVFGQAKKPTLMVLPSDNWCEQRFFMTQFDNPAMAAAITCLTFGSVLLFGSIMGGIGFTTKVCKRIGIALSAYLAPCVAFFYLVVIIALLADHATFFNYLTEHKDVLYLSSSEITSLNDLLPFFYIVLIALGVMEMLRCEKHDA